MIFETCPGIELAVAGYFDTRRCLIVPNVHWGLDINHECDMFIVNKTGFAYEVEIKVSRSDLKADLKKPHQHKSKKIRRLYFAIPEKLLLCQSLVPEHAGILSISKSGRLTKIREAKSNKDARILSDKERIKLGHLAAMRMWNLKKQIFEKMRVER